MKKRLFSCLSFTLLACAFLLGQGRLNLNWSTTFGSGQSFSEAVSAMTCNAAGEVYVAGKFEGTMDFDPSSAENVLVTRWGELPFLVKYSPQGHLVWAKMFDAPGEITDMAVTADDALVLTGHVTERGDFDPGPGRAMIGNYNGVTAFLLKLDAAGVMEWLYSFDDVGTISPSGVAIDTAGAGDIYLTGHFIGHSDFDPSAEFGLAQTAGPGSRDAFVARYDHLGRHQWVKVIGSADNDQGIDIACTGPGKVVAGFAFDGPIDLDPGAGVQTFTPVGSWHDIGLVQYDQSGALIWFNQLAGHFEEGFSSLTAGPNGSVWVGATMGDTWLKVDRFSGLIIQSVAGRSFVAHYDGGGHLIRTTFVGDVGSNIKVNSLAWDREDGLLLGGNYWGPCDFDNRPGFTAMRYSGLGGNFYAARYDTTMVLQWVSAWENSQYAHAKHIQALPGGGVVATGGFEGSADLDPGAGNTTISKPNFPGIVVCQYGPGGAFQWASTTEERSGGNEDARQIAHDPQGNIGVLGTFNRELDLDPGTGTQLIHPEGIDDIYVQKMDAQGGFLWGGNLHSIGGIVDERLFFDAQGNMVIIAEFSDSIDMDWGPGNTWFHAPASGPAGRYRNAFVIGKYDPDGNLIMASAFGYGRIDIDDADIDPDGRVYLTGTVIDTIDLDPGPGQYWITPVFPQRKDFLLCLDLSGHLAWAHTFPGNFYGDKNRLEVSANGMLFWGTRLFDIIDLDPDPVKVLMADSLAHYAISRYDWDGNFIMAYQQKTERTNPGGLDIYALDSDSQGNLYATGTSTAGWDFDQGPGTSYLSAQGQLYPNNIPFLFGLDTLGGLLFVAGFPPFNFIGFPDLRVTTTGTIAVSTWISAPPAPQHPLGALLGDTGDRIPIVGIYADGAWQAAATIEKVHPIRFAFINGFSIRDDGTVVIGGSLDAPMTIHTAGAGGALQHNGQVDAFLASLSYCQAPQVRYRESQRIVCHGDAPFTLSSGVPAGGTYTGAGVSGNLFDPRHAGLGPVHVTYLLADPSGCVASASDTIYVNVCTSAAPPTPKSTFQLHPNPSTGRLVLTASDWQGGHLDLQLYNAWGQQVHSARLREGDAELQLDHLPAGMYVAALSGKAGKATLRWVKVD
jgi:hypothetical protein